MCGLDGVQVEPAAEGGVGDDDVRRVQLQVVRQRFRRGDFHYLELDSEQ